MNKQELIERIDRLNEPYLKQELVLKWVEQLEEPEKPVVPPAVSVWYQINKDNLYKNIAYLCANWTKSTTDDTLFYWMSNTDNFIEILINMHRFGYIVEKEPKYTVKFKATKQYLCNDDLGPHFDQSFRTNFTKSDLEKLGLGWVFECEGMEVEEVTE